MKTNILLSTILLLIIQTGAIFAQSTWIPVYTALTNCNTSQSYYCANTCLHAHVWNNGESNPDLPPASYYMSYKLTLQKSMNSTNTSWSNVGGTTTILGTTADKDYTITQSGTYRIYVTASAATGWPLPATPIVQQYATRTVNVYNPIVANFKINNQSVSSTSILSTFNCKPITLSNTSTGTQFSTGNPANFQYKIIVTPTDANNNIISVPSSTSWTSAALTSVNLTTLFPSLLNSSTTGFFRVELQAKNLCNGTVASTKIGRIQVSGLIPTTIVGNFVEKITYDPTITPGNNCNSAAIVGKETPIFKFIGSTGEQITSYFLKIERFTSCTSAPILVVDAQNSPTNVSAPIEDIVIPIDSYIGQKINNYNYWRDNVSIYKITATFTNPCGNTSQVFWVNNSGDWKTNPNEITTNTDISIVPNPFSDYAQVSYTLEKESKVNLRIIDLNGRTVAQPILNTQQSGGMHSINIHTYDLPKGMYIYELQTDNGKSTGKIFKID